MTKIGPVEPLCSTSVLIKGASSNNREQPDSFISKKHYFCAVN